MGDRTRRLLAAVLAVATFGAVAALAGARSFRNSFGTVRRHTHATWAGPSVGLIAWGVYADFSSFTPCGSSVAGLNVSFDWNSSSLHNGAVLAMYFTVTRSDGKKFPVGPAIKISKAESWGQHPAFSDEFRVGVQTPRGTYLNSGAVHSFIVNNGVPYPPLFSDSVRFHQYTKSC
jgi:hypothetical protein